MKNHFRRIEDGKYLSTERSLTITCPFCKNKQTAFIKGSDLYSIPHIVCIVKHCNEIISGELLETAIAETQFYTPGQNNKY